MFTCGVSRSSVRNASPPERRAMKCAVSGVTCMSPWAPALDVWPLTNFDSA
jgi:hypothetical protein